MRAFMGEGAEDPVDVPNGDGLTVDIDGSRAPWSHPVRWHGVMKKRHDEETRDSSRSVRIPQRP